MRGWPTRASSSRPTSRNGSRRGCPGLAHLTFQDLLGDYRKKTDAPPGARGRDRAPGRQSGSRRGGPHGGAAVQGGPHDPRRQGVHGPSGDHGRDLRPPGAPPRRRLEGHLRPVPPRLRLGRSTARSVGRDPVSRRSLRFALLRFSASASSRPAPATRTACAARRSAPSRSPSSRNWRTDWRPIARKALSLLPADLPGPSVDETLDELGRFFAERLRALLERRGHHYDEISAVLNVGVWDFADAADRARALSEARRHMDFRSLILAFKRIRNIVGQDSHGDAEARLCTARTPSASSPPISSRRGRRSRRSSASATIARPWRRSRRSRRRSTASSSTSW